MKKFSRRSVFASDGKIPSEKRRAGAEKYQKSTSDGHVTDKHQSAEEHILDFASEIILVVGSGRCTLDDLLDDSKYRDYRRTLSHLLLGYFKYKKSIEKTVSSFCRKAPAPETFALLKAALAQAITQHRMAPQAVVNVAVELAKKHKNHGFVNAVLRKAVGEFAGKELPSAPGDVLPDFLLEKWKKEFTAEEIKELTAAFLSAPEFTFRMEKGTVPVSFEYKEAFSVSRDFPFGKAAPAAVLGSEEFRKGNIYVQDPAASLAVSMAPEANFDNILDLCAAPGGKSLMLLEKYPDVEKFVAYDRSSRRQQLTRKNFELRNISHTVTCDRSVLEDEWQLILLDAPCSNTGVFRRRPDALWRFSSEELLNTVKIQKDLLDFSSSHVSSGGYILYSTCSIECEEDEEQVKAFLSRHKDFSLITQKKLLPGEEHDGAFCALLKRK